MYVVAGVTGRTGKVVANTLLDRGKKVRVVVRDAAKAKDFAARGAEIAVADLSDATALARAFSGAEGAYLLVPPNMATADFRAYQDDVSRALASALRESKVPHVVLLSSIGADLPGGAGPISGLHLTEQLFSELPATKATFLRAGYFTENLGGSLGALAQNILPSFIPAKLPVDMIASRDIGDVAATLLLEGPPSSHTIVNLGGPPVTMEDAAAALSKILGKPIQVAEAPLDAVVPTFTSFGFSQDLAGLYRDMLAKFTSGEIQWQPQHRRLQGKTPVEAVLRELVAASK